MSAVLPLRPNRWLALKLVAPVALLLGILLAPTPPGLTEAGQRVLAVMALAVVLWATEALPVAVTGLLGVLLLVVLGAVPGLEAALYGFSQPVSYFLIGILTLGLAVHRSGLAERLAVYLIRMAGGSPHRLYIQMLVSFAALTFALPSASTRGAIMVHIYEQVMAHWHVPQEARLNRAVMLAMAPESKTICTLATSVRRECTEHPTAVILRGSPATRPSTMSMSWIIRSMTTESSRTRGTNGPNRRDSMRMGRSTILRSSCTAPLNRST